MTTTTRPRYFTPAQVAAHCTTADLWVSFLGKVCDLTPLAQQHAGERRVTTAPEVDGSVKTTQTTSHNILHVL